MVVIDLTKNEVEQMVICFPRRTPIQSDAGARRLQILVSCTSVVWDGKYLNMLTQVSLKAVHKEICKKKREKAVTLTSQKSPLGVSLSLCHTHIGLGFGRLCSKKKHIMLLAVLIFFRNFAKIMLLSENYALCHRNYAT